MRLLLGEQFGEVDGGRRVQRALLLDLRQPQERLDQGLQAFALRQCVIGEALALALRQSGFRKQLGGAVDGSERAFHLMRQVLHVAFDVGAAVDLIAQLRQGARQFADFVASPRRWRRGLPSGQRAGIAQQFTHRYRQPGGKQRADYQCRAEQKQAVAQHGAFAARDDRRQCARGLGDGDDADNAPGVFIGLRAATGMGATVIHLAPVMDRGGDVHDTAGLVFRVVAR